MITIEMIAVVLAATGSWFVADRRTATLGFAIWMVANGITIVVMAQSHLGWMTALYAWFLLTSLRGLLKSRNII